MLQADCSQWFMLTQQEQHVPEFLPWMLLDRPPLLAHHVSLVLQTPAESTHTTDPLCPAGAVIRQCVHQASNRPTVRFRSNGWRCSTGWQWFYPIVNVANTAHLLKHYSFCLQRPSRGHMGRRTERHLILDHREKQISNTISTQYALIIPWCQQTQSLRVLHFFPAVYFQFI